MHEHRLREELRRPEAYERLLGRRPTEIETDETHISLLFFTREEVFKVKKALDLGFLDFRTLESRRHFCREEVRLNEPLAPGVYRGVVGILEDEGALRFAGPDEGDRQPVELAVRMRRLPADRMMDHLLESADEDAVTAGMLDELAARIAAFHAEAERHPEAGRPQRVRDAVLGNLEECREHVGSTLSAQRYRFLRDHTASELEDLAPTLEERALGGLVVEGHGDLHAEHVCFTDPLIVYDRLEFSRELRFTDVAAEVGFLAMDLDHRGHRELARAWLEAYARHAGVDTPDRVLDLYRLYRAAVRAKVASIKAEEDLPEPDRREAANEARDYFALAVGYALHARGPRIVAVCGPIASGKSLLAGRLADRLGFAWVRSDVERKALAGLEPTASPRDEEERKHLYGASMTARTYERLLERAEDAVAEGRSVVLDATYQRRRHRRDVRALADRLGVPLEFLLLEAPEDVLAERLEARETQGPQVSDARADLLVPHLAAWEWPGEDEADLVRIDSKGAPEENHEKALDALLPR